MATQQTLKLVGAERYSCVLLDEGQVKEKGAVVVVSEETAAVLLADVRLDTLNNEHPVWIEVAEGTVEGDEDNAAPVQKTARRTQRSK